MAFMQTYVSRKVSQTDPNENMYGRNSHKLSQKVIHFILLMIRLFKPKTHQASALAANAGLWWRLGMGLGLIFKRHHRPALAADAVTTADAQCGYTLRSRHTAELWYMLYFYRPQRSCGQGNIFTPVCHSVHGGCLPQCMLGYHTPRADTPLSWHPPGADPPGADTLWEQTPPRAETPPPRADPPRSRHPPRADTPQSRHPLEQKPPRADTPGEQTLPREQTAPWSRHTPPSTPPQEQTPPGNRHPPRSRLRHTVNERPVRILLECILVMSNFIV